jgi:hypothetical protein
MRHPLFSFFSFLSYSELQGAHLAARVTPFFVYRVSFVSHSAEGSAT